MLRGIDISKYDGYAIDMNGVYAIFDFCIMKCGGQDWQEVYTDSAFVKNRNAAETINKFRGYYWFNGHNTTPSQGAQTFSSILGIIGDQAILALDVEAYTWNKTNYPMWNEAQIYEFFCALKAVRSNQLYLYASDASFKNLYSQRVKELGVKAWIARYGGNTGKADAVPNNKFDLWQYTSLGSQNHENSTINSSRGNSSLDCDIAQDDAFAAMMKFKIGDQVSLIRETATNWVGSTSGTNGTINWRVVDRYYINHFEVTDISFNSTLNRFAYLLGTINLWAIEQDLKIYEDHAFIYLNANVSSWRIYDVNDSALAGHEIGYLRPSLFAGLLYSVETLNADSTAIIVTEDFGTVRLFIDNDAQLLAGGACLMIPASIP